MEFVAVEQTDARSRAAEAPRPTWAEKRLASRLARADRRVLSDLYAEHGRLTFGFLLRALRDRGAAEDVQQQVFLEAWQRRRDYDPRRASPQTWLLMIARSRAADFRRRRIPEPADPHAAAALETGANDPELDALHDRWWLAGALAELSDGEARLLRLRFGAGLTQAEIARATGLPLGTVKSRMARALARLRIIIERDA